MARGFSLFQAIASLPMRKLRLLAVLGLSVMPAGATETVTYTYDALGRVIQSTHAGSVNNGQQTVYTLDAAGNRTATATSGAAP